MQHATPADLCDQLLGFSGKGRFVVKPINLSEVVEVMGQLIVVALDKSVVVKYDLAKDLPAIDADMSQLQQIILNLIINASEAIEGKTGLVTVVTGTGCQC